MEIAEVPKDQMAFIESNKPPFWFTPSAISTLDWRSRQSVKNVQDWMMNMIPKVSDDDLSRYRFALNHIKQNVH